MPQYQNDDRKPNVPPPESASVKRKAEKSLKGEPHAKSQAYEESELPIGDNTTSSAQGQKRKAEDELQDRREGIKSQAADGEESVAGDRTKADGYGDEAHRERRTADWSQQRPEEDHHMTNGLVSMGYDREVAEWMINEVEEIPDSVDNLRQARLIYGKGMKPIYSHVSEAYSPTRVSGMADKMGLVPGFALDLTKDEYGNPLDFNVDHMRAQPRNWSRAKPRRC